MQRREFFQKCLLTGPLSTLAIACHKNKTCNGEIIGASAKVGHLLRNNQFPKPSSSENTKVIIIGSGISGLSAARYLYNNGITDIKLLELEKYIGGNAASGKNDIGKFPLGAHYVPVPNNNLTDYLSFLEKAKVITGYKDNLPIYNEEYLCFHPEERLYINGHWQDGLIPSFGVPKNDTEQINNFLSLMKEYRFSKGNDGKDAFAIPVDASSKDPQFTKLDNVTMSEWLAQQGFNSTYLNWYINYCTRDDFGTTTDNCSAWVAIHYFASRKGVGANADYGDVLTWPEGNDFLVKQLSQDLSDVIFQESLAINILTHENTITVNYYDVKSNITKQIIAEQCIIAVPQFIAARLLADKDRMKLLDTFHYVPWMVANIVTKKLIERTGQPVSWDNVIYNSNSLGYIDSTHQFLEQKINRRNLTYYLPLTNERPTDARKKAFQMSHSDWVTIIIDDLRKIHPNIEDAIELININLWGHAMVQPIPGIIHGKLRQELKKSIRDTIHFAHTDTAGISIFEEGFYQGINAAKKVLLNV